MKPLHTFAFIVASSLLLISCGGGSESTSDESTNASVGEGGRMTVQATVPGTWAGRAPVINTSGDIPYQTSAIEPTGQPLGYEVGEISNQYDIISTSSEYQARLDLVRSLSKVRIVATRAPGLIVVEIDNKDADAVRQTESLKAQLGSDISQALIVGKEIDLTQWIPDPNSNYSDLADNWHLEVMRLPAAWELYRGPNIPLIGVADMAFAYSHSSIRQVISGNVSGDRSYIAELYRTYERHLGHGTGVASIIAGQAMAGTAGITPGGKIVAGSSFFYFNTSRRLLEILLALAIHPDVKVINASVNLTGGKCEDGLGDTSTCPADRIRKVFSRKFRSVAHKYPDKLFVLSAGNGAVNAKFENGAIHLADDMVTVDRLSNVIIVGASRATGARWSYSNTGELVDVYAPSGVKAAKLVTQSGTSTFHEASQPSDYGSVDTAFNGTSAAAPQISGIAALVAGANSALNASEIKETIVRTAWSRSPNTPRMVDAEAAVKEAIRLKNEANCGTTSSPQVAGQLGPSYVASVGEPVTFNTTYTAKAGATVAVQSFHWRTDSQGVDTGGPGQAAFTNTFAAAGTKTVTVTPVLTDGTVCTGSAASSQITVVDPTPQIQIAASGSGSVVSSDGRVNCRFASGVPSGACSFTSNQPSTVLTAIANASGARISWGGICFGTTSTCTVPLGVNGQSVVVYFATQQYSLVPNASGGTYPIEECVHDNFSGLTWEGKTASGLRSGSLRYTIYNDLRSGDASAYVKYVNDIKLCGYMDWRLPKLTDFFTIDVSKFQDGTAAVDNVWLPNTGVGMHWTSDINTYYNGANVVCDLGGGYIDNGCANIGGKAQLMFVKLVR